jgi:Cu-Zn family superoxide dismutase
MKTRLTIVLMILLFVVAAAHAEQMVVPLYAINAAGTGAQIGTITVTSNAYGTLFTPDLKGLSPGLHGFHVHEKPSCEPAAKEGKMVPGLGAGGHYDPANTGRHEGPYGEGHLGDLPALYVDAAGTATHTLLAPRLKPSDLHGRALMIHAGADNYADQPEKLGGGGPRVACGVVP